MTIVIDRRRTITGFDDDRHRAQIRCHQMDARQETSPTRGSGKQQPARDRIVRSAAALVRERGVHGVGMRQIVAHADGPRGSLQRYFPGGKTQLVTEALQLVGAEVLEDTESRLVDAATLVKFGAQKSTAEDDASVLLAALEGALVLSRANQSTEPLDTVQRFFTTSLTQAAANPASRS